MNIGGVEIPFVSNIETTENTPHTEIKALGIDSSVLTSHESNIDSIAITFVLVKPFHSQDLDIGQQREQVKALEDNHWKDNDVDFLGYNGFISVDNVSVQKEGATSGMYPGTLEGSYLPYPEYTAE